MSKEISQLSNDSYDLVLSTGGVQLVAFYVNLCRHTYGRQRVVKKRVPQGFVEVELGPGQFVVNYREFARTLRTSDRSARNWMKKLVAIGVVSIEEFSPKVHVGSLRCVAGQESPGSPQGSSE